MTTQWMRLIEHLLGDRTMLTKSQAVEQYLCAERRR